MSEVERLLVVDDEAPILHALQRTFEAAGYQVTACADPAEALDRLREKPYQVLSADYMMPGMTGAEFLAQAKALQPETIRILVTAAHDFSAAVDAINNGEIFRILAKPWNRVELLGTVRQAFDTYALREKNRQLTAIVQSQNAELAMLNKGLERLVEERTTNLLDGMVAVLDYRDTETQWHSRRVSRFTRRIAEQLGVKDPLELRTIEMGALLHDIGKIGVRDAVLLKPGPLDQDEWTEMREHPRLGWALLQRIEFLRDASVIVLQHQERYDGGGYPAGLKAEQIVLGARLFAVADTYDAITSDRPYRKAQSHDQAITEMQRVAGTQLDPRGVAAFCGLPEAEWQAIRRDVEKISLLEQEWGWTPPKRIFEQIREIASRQKQPISDPPPHVSGS
ncbi:MAG: HD domain-containing protein [Deltaproteobacteria bacterium]|nr:MAG: HD domain-containing protein [Deltaproteobacteria bacterium]